jgi:hypothetical protein
MAGSRRGLPFLVSLAALMAGCAGAPTATASITGNYNCGIEGEEVFEQWELREGGTLIVTVVNPPPDAPPEESFPETQEGTWTIEDGQVIINYAGANNDPFNVEEGRLVFAGEAGPGGTWTCTKAS